MESCRSLGVVLSFAHIKLIRGQGLCDMSDDAGFVGFVLFPIDCQASIDIA